MKILHLISSGGMYGAEAVIINLSRELNGTGAHRAAVGVFAGRGGPEPLLYGVARKAGLDAYLVECNGPLDGRVPGRVRRLAATLSADLLHAHGYKADVYGWAAFRRAGPAMVSTCHTWYDNDLALKLYGKLDRLALRRFAGVVAVSPEVKQQLLQAGVPAERVRMIRNGVSLDGLTILAPEHRREQAGRSLRVGLVGRLAPEKGIDLFLRAVAEVREEFSGVQFVVAGDGPERTGLAALQEQLGLAGAVQFLGQQSDMGAFYQSLDVLVSASRQEGLPVALLEGMASGLPVIATTVGAVPEVVQHGRTGILVTPESPGELAEAIRTLLRDAALRRSLGEAGVQRVAEEFSAQRMMQEYLALYQQVLAR